MYFLNKFEEEYLTNKNNIAFIRFNNQLRKKKSMDFWYRIFKGNKTWLKISNLFSINGYFNTDILIVNNPVDMKNDFEACKWGLLNLARGNIVNDDQTFLNLHSSTILTIDDFS